MNTFTYTVTLTNHSPATLTKVTVLYMEVQASTVKVAERTLDATLSVMFKGDPQVKWHANLVHYVPQAV